MRKFHMLIISCLFLLVIPYQVFAAAAPLKISLSKNVLQYGESIKIKAVNSTKQKIIYKTSNTKIVTVKSDGTVKALFPGKAKITASAGKAAASITVTVLPKVEDVKVSLKDNVLFVNQTAETNPIVRYLPVNAPRPAISMKIADPSIAKVDEKGRITGLKEGRTVLTLAAGTFKKNYPLTVKYGEILWSKSIECNLWDSLSWSGSNNMAAVGKKVYYAKNAKLLKEFKGGNIQFYSGGLGFLTYDGRILLYDNSLKETKNLTFDSDHEYDSNLGEGRYSIRFTNDNKVVFHDFFGTSMIDLTSGDRIMNYMGLYGGLDEFSLLELSPDQQTLAAAEYDTLHLINRDTGKESGQYTMDGKIGGLSFTPDGKYLALILSDNKESNLIELLNLETSLIDYTITIPKGYITSLAFTPDGKYLAAGGRDGMISLYQTADYSLYRTFTTDYNRKPRNTPNPAAAISISPDGTKLLALYDVKLTQEPNLILWNLPHILKRSNT